MVAASYGHTDTAIALVKAKANINAKTKVRIGLAGWMVMCVQRLTPFGVECAGAKVEMSRVCRCSASHADVTNHDDTVWKGCDVKGERKESS